MGLDITVLRGITLTKAGPFDEAHENEPHLYVHPDFPGRNDGLQAGHYTAEAELKFRAGSYSGYNSWRNELAQLAGNLDAESVWNSDSRGGPFYELINFADNEGTIGDRTSAKLAKDFSEHQARADEHPDPWFRELYGLWRRAFEMASDHGAVSFH